MSMPLIFLAAAAAVPAPAATPPVVVAVSTPVDDAHLDPKALAAARALLLSTGADKQVVEMAQKSAHAMLDASAAARGGADVPADLRATLEAVLNAHLAKHGPELAAAVIDGGARIYARYFTVDEIAELQRLQTNPVMMKFKTIAPSFMAEFIGIGATAAARFQPELEAELKAAAERWAADHARRSHQRRS